MFRSALLLTVTAAVAFSPADSSETNAIKHHDDAFKLIFYADTKCSKDTLTLASSQSVKPMPTKFIVMLGIDPQSPLPWGAATVFWFAGDDFILERSALSFGHITLADASIGPRMGIRRVYGFPSLSENVCTPVANITGLSAIGPWDDSKPIGPFALALRVAPAD